MTPTIDYLIKYFDIYNVKYFYGKLPRPVFELNNSIQWLGYYRRISVDSRKIVISKAYEGPEVFFQNTLIHEMIHYYLDYIGDVDKGWRHIHGPNFKREATRINQDGWNIKRCATQEEMSKVTLVKKRGRPYVINAFSVLENPMDENLLIDFILLSRSKDKDVILWFSYPEIQRMVYSELNEDDCPIVYQEKRCKAIIKAYNMLIRFNYGNQQNLYVLHSDAMHFYKAIGNERAANIHLIESKKYEGAVSTATYTINGRTVTPIKSWNNDGI